MKVFSKIMAFAGFAVFLMHVNCIIAYAETMYKEDYCISPPFISQPIPPQVLFALGKDHKFFYPAYNDVSDIDGDGLLDVGYRHSIVYKGYFDPNKCYSYGQSNGKSVFLPASVTSNRYCDGTKWSGNFLNWVAMSRADIVKKVMYGGLRTRDDSSGAAETFLSGEGIPQDGHSWGKEYSGNDITGLVPSSEGVVNGHRALFCMVHNGRDNDDFKLTTNAAPIGQLRMLPDMQASVFTNIAGVSALNENTGLRVWNWVNVEMGSATSKNICSDAGMDINGDGSMESVTNFPVRKYDVTVKVCDSSVGREDNCREYGNNWKPVGLMQKYGEATVSQKVCSRDMYTSCSSNSNCSGLGECIDKSDMYFGMIAGSYKNPKAGGYLRKNIWSMTNETVQSTGLLNDDNSDQKGLIIKSVEGLKCPAGTGYYPLSNHWGNPIGELLYEGMRFWGGMGTPTRYFVEGITSTSDAGLYASKPAWEQPGRLFPSCSIPFVLLFSDIYNSFDDDQLPGSAFSSFTNPDGELAGINVRTLSNRISTNEAKTSAIIGVSGTTSGLDTNEMCTAKSISTSGFGGIKGICPAEADLQGTYYPAAVSLYGRTLMRNNMSVPNVFTYVVAFNSNIPEFVVYAGDKPVNVIPMAKALADGTSVSDWSCNTTNFNFAVDATRGLTITPKANRSGKCPTMAIVNVYVTGARYDDSDHLTYVKFKVSSDTLNATIDYDMDGVAEYTICAGPGANGCNDNTVGSGEVKVTVEAKASAAGTNFAHGYVISGTGTTTDGVYLPVRKFKTNDKTPPAACGTLMWGDANLCSLAITDTKKFTASNNNPGLLRNPLWYAAKYGGFNDMDNDGLPFTDYTCDPKTRGTADRNVRCNEWDTKGNGEPDNYFLVSNPSELEGKLGEALNAILARTASGTAASILSNSQGSGANILQALFYPQRIYENNTNVSWAGELQNLWYYVDPFIGGSTIREDSDYTTADPLPAANPAHSFNLNADRIIQFFFDADSNQTMARRIKNNGTFEEVFPDDPENGVMSLWNAGKLLWRKSPASRTIYTSVNGTSLLSFNDTIGANVTALRSYLQAGGDVEATRIMQYIRGYDDVCFDTSSPCTKSRSRTVTIRKRGGGAETHAWKLGDIVTSTPRVQANQGLQTYNLTPPSGYSDATYRDFINSSNYGHRGMVYVGANDGMLHAFKLGLLNTSYAIGDIQATLSGQNLGEEQWGFIPRHVLPYLKYQMDPDYKDNHIFFVDGSTSLFDISTQSSMSDYWNDTKTCASWKTILIGSMGIGGASRINTSSCNDGSDVSTDVCVKTPILDPADSTGNKGLGYSSYFALDITNQNFTTDAANTLSGQPTLKWEFSDPSLGFATSGPVLVRINAKTSSGSSKNHNPAKNGRWLAVFASGPTGPIDKATHQFKGRSNQRLKLFVVDAEKGPTSGNWWVIDTGIDNAFAGNIAAAVGDTERTIPLQEGFYQDDVLYIGYTKRSTAGTWTDGGILRVVIPHDNDPDNLELGNSITPINTSGFDPVRHWVVSKVIEGDGSNNIGAVSTSVAKLQGGSLYLFFGSGRYFFPQDDMTSQRRLYMVKDKCYKSLVTHPDTTKKTRNDIDDNATAACSSTLSLSDLTNRTDASDPANDTTVTNGWYINLDAGERVVTDTVATVNGAVYYTTFIPNTNICSFGGSTNFWAVKYNTGFQLPANSKQGKALIQVSTGSFEEVDISRLLTASYGRKTAVALVGKPPQDPTTIISKAGLTPLKRILHIQERVK